MRVGLVMELFWETFDVPELLDCFGLVEKSRVKTFNVFKLLEVLDINGNKI